MKIKATITVEYNVNPEEYCLLEKCDQKQAIRTIEHHRLREAIFEIMPWSGLNEDDQVLKIELEALK